MRTIGIGRAGERDDKALMRTATMLIALATLTERAAGRSLLVRYLVLWLLRSAEAKARVFVAETASLVPVGFSGDASGSTPDDAARLAEDFRALAAALLAFLHQSRRLIWGQAGLREGSVRHARSDADTASPRKQTKNASFAVRAPPACAAAAH